MDKKSVEIICEFLDEFDIDIDLPAFMSDDIDEYEDFRVSLYDNGAFDVEVIYYSDAMKYLMENDPSLSDSMELASYLGYETKHLNSCLLASLLQSEEIKEQYYKIENEIEEFFENIESYKREKKLDEVLDN